MKILWIGGWGISVESMRLLVVSKFPMHEHICIHPHKKFQDFISKCQPDAIVGYSLGATLLLKTSSLQVSRYYLIAPFINIKDATYVNNTQIKYLLKWVKKEPLEAINDFIMRAKISHSEMTTTLPYPLDDLIWGIEVLIKSHEISIEDNAFVLPKQILLGLKDPLINGDFFLENFANLTITISDADHNLEYFLNSLPF